MTLAWWPTLTGTRPAPEWRVRVTARQPRGPTCSVGWARAGLAHPVLIQGRIVQARVSRPGVSFTVTRPGLAVSV